ncbi:MAG: hypothetical protein JXR89_03800 [Deltaproteobacteria bacterium]|nr:hypothetical protein [Deltaproteobacteria bacterium]
MRLICAAVREELLPLLESSLWSESEPGRFYSRRRPCLLAALGVGLVDFVAGFEALLRTQPIASAIFTGSCGVYAAALSSWPPVTLVSPGNAILGDLAEAEGKGYFPGPLATALTLDEKLSRQLSSGYGTRCLTLAAITSEEQAAARLEAHYQAHFEQMEAYAFARICRRHRLSGAMLLAVVNQVGVHGHQQWLVNAARGAQACAARLREVLAL